MSTNILRIPYGTKDILPGEARLKRKMEDQIADNFLSWGYDEAITPTFEYADTFALSGAGITEESMKFMDRESRTMILRTEMTTPLARMVATRLKADKGIKRLFYIATCSATNRPRPAANANSARQASSSSGQRLPRRTPKSWPWPSAA
mgnify:CR=1 FL=1